MISLDGRVPPDQANLIPWGIYTESIFEKWFFEDELWVCKLDVNCKHGYIP